MKFTSKIPSEFGPVDLELFQCDNCSRKVQEPHMVGWHLLSPQGIQVTTMASLPGDLDFCSLECLLKAVKTMTGQS